MQGWYIQKKIVWIPFCSFFDQITKMSLRISNFMIFWSVFSKNWFSGIPLILCGALSFWHVFGYILLKIQPFNQFEAIKSMYNRSASLHVEVRWIWILSLDLMWRKIPRILFALCTMDTFCSFFDHF